MLSIRMAITFLFWKHRYPFEAVKPINRHSFEVALQDLDWSDCQHCFVKIKDLFEKMIVP
jgi:hypothetical protein